MQNLHKLRFLKRFPGPYDYQRGVDGVDETFDIVCVANGRYVISTYFWDEVQRNEAIASVVTSALNQRAGWYGFVCQSYAEHHDAFQQTYPGPYRVRRECCQGRGPLFTVYCTTTNESVIDSYGHDGEARLIANQISAALNALDEPIPASLPG